MNESNAKGSLKEIGVQPARGFRDLLPQQTALRDRVSASLLETYRSFGFERIEAPALEDIRRLRASEGGENLTLLFEILKRGSEFEEALSGTERPSREALVDLALRYDLTVPLCRYFANNRAQLLSPFKAIHMGPVWRAERPQHGRFRQFVQCDIDSIGLPAPLAECELITVTVAALKRIGLSKATVRLNDRRILCGLVLSQGIPEDRLSKTLIILDKLDKIGLDGVEKLLRQELPEVPAVNKLLGALQQITAAEVGQRLQVTERVLGDFPLAGPAFAEMSTILSLQRNLGAYEATIEFDPLLVRGMGYYTGAIFEISLPEFGSGSVAGGGRYDNLIGKFSGTDAPACGFSIGFERILGILEEREAKVQTAPGKLVLFYDKQLNPVDVLVAVEELRGTHATVSMLPQPKNMKHALERLREHGFSEFVVFKPGEALQPKAIA